LATLPKRVTKPRNFLRCVQIPGETGLDLITSDTTRHGARRQRPRSRASSGLAAAYVIYPPQLSIWIHDPTHVAELGFIVLLAITASKAVGVIIDGKPLGSSGARAASRRM
jgi:hypothetical protein